MKAKTFENLIRKVVREEIDYALRREIKSLKEDLREESKPLIKEEPIPNTVRNSLKEKIMGSTSNNKPIQNINYTNNPALNDLLNETASGDTNTESALASVNDPFSTSGVLPTENMPTGIANVVNRDYRSLMKAIDKKKGR